MSAAPTGSIGPPGPTGAAGRDQNFVLNAFAENPLAATFGRDRNGQLIGTYGTALGPSPVPPTSGASVRQRGAALPPTLDHAALGHQMPGLHRATGTGPKSKLDTANAKVNPHAVGAKEMMQVTWQQEFTVVWLASVAVLVVTTAFWAYNFLARPSVCILSSFSAIMYACGVLQLKQEKKHLYHPIAILVILSVSAGSLAGLYVYDTYTIFPSFYGNTRTYYNVVPNQPANSVADAGKLTFATEAFVDANQSAGIITEDGSIYCAAPIRDGTGISRLQFWAVGTSCCGALGEFTCDDVANADAKAGIVIFDNNNYFAPSRFTHYEKAREKAQATYGLQSVSSVAYVRWVMEGDLDMMTTYYRYMGVSVILGFGVVGAILLYVCTAFVYAPPAASGAFQPMA